MTCVHLQQLYRLCKEHDLKLAGADLIRVVCRQCNEQEVCPSMLSEQYDAVVKQQPQPEAAKPTEKSGETTRP